MFKPDRDSSDQRIAERIRVIMKRQGVSIRQLSDKAGLPYRTVQNYLTGKVSIPAIFVIKCCDVLCTEADIILFGGVDIDVLALRGALEAVLGNEITSLLHIDEQRKVTARSVDSAQSLTTNAALAMRGTILMHVAEYVREKYLAIRTEEAWLGQGYVSPGDAENERLAKLGLFPKD